VLRARALQQAGFSTRGAPLILDENLAGRGVADALRAQGYNVRSTIEIFGAGAKDPAIRSLAETIGARVITADRGRQIGQGFGDLAIQVPGQVGHDVNSIVRLLGEALK
jgi:hypothetical protein